VGEKMSKKKSLKLPQVGVGILGGTGLYEIEGIEDIKEVKLWTPFGKPSDSYVIGNLGGKRVAFLSRHSRGHKLIPSEINYRANIYGFKMLGVERVISVNSVGSLKEEIRPRDIIVSDQFFDRTKRENTFFGNGIAVHISFAQPVCPELADVLFESGKELGLRIHKGGTYLCIEGPSFSSKAESLVYRSWGLDVIGMTSATEAKLCREAEICYATLNLVSDYDTWHGAEEQVSVELVLENLRLNIHNAKAIIKKAIAGLPCQRSCECAHALENCIVTQTKLIRPQLREKLRFIIGKYVK
jgi:5'-methylthioadenosine phosphorylase